LFGGRRGLIAWLGVAAAKLIVEATGERRQHRDEFLKRRAAAAARNTGEVERWQLMLCQSKGFAEDSLPAISYDGVADFSRDGETQARMLQTVGNAAEADDSIGDYATRVEDAVEIRWLEKAEAFLKAMVSRHCGRLAETYGG
jgi:hypothetical protein